MVVEDTGIGIEEGEVETIFQEFQQGKSAVGQKEGFGLGLAIVRRLADLLGHEIGVTSVLGQGSSFSVALPIAYGAEAQHKDEEASAHPLTQSGSGMIILIEDDVRVADAWGMLLEAEGYRVAKAKSAAEARELVSKIAEAPALLISDFHLLDGSTGVEAVSDIREHYGRQIPAFIVSGDTSKVVKDARPVENCTLLSKPVNTERLLAAAKSATQTGEVPAD